jgi:NADPH2:quinone reductase
MRTVVCTELGPLDTLSVEERETPAPGDGFVVVDVRAAGVNFVDGLLCQGRYQIKPPTPFVPGGEVAGEVAAVGPGVAGVAVGDRVIAFTGFGGFAEQVAVPALSLIPMPDTVDFGPAATLIQSYCTVLFTLTRRTSLAPGEWVLVLGAAAGWAWPPPMWPPLSAAGSSPPRRARTSWRPPPPWGPRPSSPTRRRT